MQVQLGDFPSDIHGEVYKLREEMMKCLQRSCTSETGANVLRAVIKFSITKLKEADTERAAFIEKRDYVAPVEAPADEAPAE